MVHLLPSACGGNNTVRSKRVSVSCFKKYSNVCHSCLQDNAYQGPMRERQTKVGPDLRAYSASNTLRLYSAVCVTCTLRHLLTRPRSDFTQSSPRSDPSTLDLLIIQLFARTRHHRHKTRPLCTRSYANSSPLPGSPLPMHQ